MFRSDEQGRLIQQYWRDIPGGVPHSSIMGHAGEFIAHPIDSIAIARSEGRIMYLAALIYSLPPGKLIVSPVKIKIPHGMYLFIPLTETYSDKKWEKDNALSREWAEDDELDAKFGSK